MLIIAEVIARQMSALMRNSVASVIFNREFRNMTICQSLKSTYLFHVFFKSSSRFQNMYNIV